MCVGLPNKRKYPLCAKTTEFNLEWNGVVGEIFQISGRKIPLEINSIITVLSSDTQLCDKSTVRSGRSLIVFWL